MAQYHLHREIAAHLTPTEVQLLWGDIMPVLKLEELNIATIAMFNLCLAKKIPAKPLVEHLLRRSVLEYSLFSHPELARYLCSPNNDKLCYYRWLAEYHRPLCFFEYYFALYPDIFHDVDTVRLCAIAVQYNNTVLLSWLRDPNTGIGRYQWDYALYCCAAKNGNIAMLERLRDPQLDGGVCPWNIWACITAAEYGQLDALCWLRNPTIGNSHCPWLHQYCCVIAEQNRHSHVVDWLLTQDPE